MTKSILNILLLASVCGVAFANGYGPAAYGSGSYPGSKILPGSVNPPVPAQTIYSTITLPTTIVSTVTVPVTETIKSYVTVTNTLTVSKCPSSIVDPITTVPQPSTSCTSSKVLDLTTMPFPTTTSCSTSGYVKPTGLPGLSDTNMGLPQGASDNGLLGLDSLGSKPSGSATDGNPLDNLMNKSPINVNQAASPITGNSLPDSNTLSSLGYINSASVSNDGFRRMASLAKTVLVIFGVSLVF